jgi:hypothetical protein
MAVASGKPIIDFSSSRQLYTGVLPVEVVAINPTKRELNKIYGRELPGDEPVYFSRTNDGTHAGRLRVDFIVRTIPEKCDGIKLTGRLSFFLRDSVQYNGDKSKFKAINIYNQTTWLTKEEYKEGRLPEGVKPHFFLQDNIRPAYVGEEALMKFIAIAINIPSVYSYATGDIIKNKAEAECRLDSMKEMVTTGNTSELKKLLPAFKIFKIGAGVRTTEDNRTYQDWFVDYPMRFGLNDFKYYDTQIKRAKEVGRYPNTDFGEMPYKPTRYEVKPSKIDTTIEETTVVETSDDELDW